jgi:hypothetical protein
MGSSRKRGKLSKIETRYIEQNCFDMSLADIALHLNRTIEPIKKYIDKANLKARDLTDHEHLLSTLRSRYYFKEIKKQFDDGEITFFEHMWIDYFRQFNEDVVHTEEMQIVEVARTEILINRSMKDRYEIVEVIESLETMIDEEMDREAEDRDTQALASFQTQLGAMIGSKSSYINEHEKLLTKKERLLKDLKGTREQRKRIAEDANTNFLIWMRQLDDLAAKDREGFDLEVNRIAANKARERLAEYHEYEDGMVDQPLLNSETVKDEEPDVRDDPQDAPREEAGTSGDTTGD